MSVALTRALWAVLAVLAGLVAFEWIGGASEPARLAAPRPHAAAQPQEAETRETSDWAAAILQRPLFSASRKPVRTAKAGGIGANPAMPRLAGIMITPEGRRAIFASIGVSKPLVLAEGGSVNDVVIRAIQPDRVILASGMVMLPSYDKTRIPGVGGTQPFVPIAPNFQPGFQNPAFQNPGYPVPGQVNPGAYPAPGYQPGFQPQIYRPPQPVASQGDPGEQETAPPQPGFQPGFRPILPPPRSP